MENRRAFWFQTMLYADEQSEELYWETLRLRVEERYAEAWQSCCRALEVDPDNVPANSLAGDLWLRDWDAIGYGDHSKNEAAVTALGYFERAVEVEPAYADAWAGKTYALFYLKRYEEALRSAQAGRAALPLCVGPEMQNPEVYRLVGEEVYDSGIQTLLELGRVAEAREVLTEALGLFPGSAFLEEHLERCQSSDLGEEERRGVRPD